MCAEIQRFFTGTICPMAATISEEAQHITSHIENSVTWLGRKIDEYTNSLLPRPAAVVAAVVLKSLPFIAMRLFLPFPLLIGGIVGVILYKAVTTPRDQLIQIPALTNGLAFGGLLTGGQQIVVGIGSGNIPHIVFGVAGVALSCFILLRSGFINEACGLTLIATDEIVSNR